MEDKRLPISGLARASLLRMASSWQSGGQINQAIDAYLKILQRWPGTPEAEDAREKLLGLAMAFEQGTRFHLAMDLYERIESVSQ